MAFCMDKIDVAANQFQKIYLDTYRGLFNTNQRRSLGQFCSHGF